MLDEGADPIIQSGFSGMRPYEAAKNQGFNSISELIISHKYYKIWVEAHKDFNESSPNKNIEYIVKNKMENFYLVSLTHLGHV